MTRHVTIVLSALLVALASCKTSEVDTPNDHGVSAVQFQDLVVPDGMTLLDRYHESHSREEAGWRFGHYVYTGQLKVDEASEHLLVRMPQHAWRLVSDERPNDTSRRMRFARGRYLVDYSLRREDGVTEMVIDYRTDIEGR